MDYEVKVQGLDGLISALKNAGGDARPLITKAVVASGLHIQQRARELAPHRTGTLQRSILLESSTMYSKVKVNEKYGVYLEQGTGPYDIYPSKKKALFWPGADHPVRVVHHPGTAARPFFGPAIQDSKSFIHDQFHAATLLIVKLIASRAKV